MSKNLYLTTGAVILGTVSQIVSALDAPTGLSARVGANFCLNRSKVNLLKTPDTYESPKISIAAGVDYKLGDIGLDLGEPGQRSSWGISLDYYGSGNRYNIPLLANFRGKMDQFEYSIGAGVGFGREYDSTVTVKGFKNKCNVSFQLSGRYYFQKTSENPIFLEARYYGSSKSELTGFAAMIGISL